MHGFTRAALAAALGLRPGDLEPTLPLEFVSTGIFNLMVPLEESERAAANSDEYARTRAIGFPSGTMAYCFALGSRGRAFARGMLPWGIIEDPATGSAGGSLGAYLVHHGRLRAQEELIITQGMEMGRPSEIRVEIIAERGRLVPKVSGSAVRIFEGHIEA